MKYSGIDLHSNNSVVTVIDETDKVVAEKRLPNDLTKILAFLEPHRDELGGVVVESTFNWYWLVDGLQEAGHTVHLANTTAIKKLNIVATKRTPGTWLICYDLASCPPGPSCRQSTEPLETLQESACNWCRPARLKC